MYWLLAVALVLLADRATKHLVLRRWQGAAVHRSGPAIRLVCNPRIGRGWIRKPRNLLASWLALAAVLPVLALFAPALHEPQVQVGMGFAFGGAAGNLLDVMCRGAVIDFIDVGLWPVFNLADTAIVLGPVITAAGMLG